jgi:hypothetical protein
MLDPEYLRLYRRYAKAIRAYENALKKRRQLRARWRERRRSGPTPRRPVGAPPGTQVPQAPGGTTGQALKAKEMRVYLGEILGWAKLVGYPSPRIDTGDPTAQFDADAFHDNIQLQLYWNAKNYYLKCKKEFFNYVRRGPSSKGGRRPKRDAQRNLRAARGYLSDAGTWQIFGLDEGAEAFIKNAQREVENACYKLWDNYQNDPDNPEALSELIEDGLVEAQFVGIEDSPIVRKIADETNRLLNSGKLATR